MKNICDDCGKDISYKRSDARRCEICYKVYRTKYFAKYRKTDKRKETIRRDNASEASKTRKRNYNNSVKGKLSHLKYRRSEKGKTSSRVQVLKRRAKMANIGGDLSSQEIRKVKSEYSACAFCGKQEILEIEHLVPISRGGTNDYRNLVMACRKCNMQKFTLKAEEFFMKYPEKQTYFLQMNANKRKFVGIEYDSNFEKNRLRKNPEIWTKEKLEKLIYLWPTSSKEELSKEFSNSSFIALTNVIAKLRKMGRHVPNRINTGRFVKRAK